LGALSSVTYSMVERDGKPGLQIQAEPKPYSPPIVQPLILIDGSDYNNVFFSMGARITFLDFGGYRRELRNDVMVGSQYGIQTEYYRPLSGTSSWFVAPRAGFDSSLYPVFNESTLLTIYRNREALGGLDFGYAFGSTGELRLGYEGGYKKLKPQIGHTDVLPTVSGATGDVRLQYTLITLDDPVLPRKGEGVKFYTKYFHVNPAAPEGFPVSELEIQNFFQLNRRNTVFLNAYGGSTYGFNAGIPAFQLGGVTRFAAYGTNELLTNQYYLGQLGYIRTLKNLPPLLGSTIDFLGAFEVGKTYQLPHGPKPPNIPGDVVGALIVNTRFGPVEAGGAIGNYGHAKFFFQVGRIF
jgi:NTE family protein